MEDQAARGTSIRMDRCKASINSETICVVRIIHERYDFLGSKKEIKNFQNHLEDNNDSLHFQNSLEDNVHPIEAHHLEDNIDSLQLQNNNDSLQLQNNRNSLQL